MAWKKLDRWTAQQHGAVSPEDVIQVICADCPKGNLGFIDDDFCEIQTLYGVDGEHDAIQYNDEGEFDVRCTGYLKLHEEELALYDKRMRGDWS